MALPHPTPPVLLTYREFCLLPEDGRRHELIEGDFYSTPSPAPMHQRVSFRLMQALGRQLDDAGLAIVFPAPTDLILADTTVTVPDILVLRRDRKHLITRRGIEGPPEIVVEILSPSTKGNDEFLKKSVYAKFKIPEYWIVDTDHGWVSVFRLVGEAYLLAKKFDRAGTLESGEFPELRIPLAPIFEEI